jgi:hypothetical protein
MMVHPLEGLALAGLSELVLVKKLAALWCRHFGNTAPSGGDVLAWIKEEYGPVAPKGRARAVSFALGSEVKRQLAVRKRRKEARAPKDILELEMGDGWRQRKLLEGILGQPRKWVSPLRTSAGAYTQYTITSGLVAAIIPTSIILRAIRAPSLLVYRQPGDTARSYWVPNDLDIAGCLVWLMPDRVQQDIKAGRAWAAHDGRLKRVRCTYTDGTVKTYPWRKLRNYID